MEYAYTSKFNERFKKENGDRGALYRKLQKLCRKYVSRNYYQNCARTTFPFLGTLRSYKVKDYLANDVISGLTVGVMQIPQGKISLLFFWVIEEIRNVHLAEWVWCAIYAIKNKMNTMEKTLSLSPDLNSTS